MTIHKQWKSGYRAKCSVEEAFDVLEMIRKRDGNITPKAVVDEARPKNSPLHPAIFEKSQKQAAEAHYLEEARKMIRSIEVIYVKAPKAPAKQYSVVTQAPEKPDDKPRKVYQSTEEALKDPVMRDEILGNAIRDAITYRRKYAHLQELAQVFTAIDEFVANAG